MHSHTSERDSASTSPEAAALPAEVGEEAEAPPLEGPDAKFSGGTTSSKVADPNLSLPSLASSFGLASSPLPPPNNFFTESNIEGASAFASS
ncbi:hypothetical protein LINPERHAP1_LOCUS42470 [Linum perenne]